MNTLEKSGQGMDEDAREGNTRQEGERTEVSNKEPGASESHRERGIVREIHREP